VWRLNPLCALHFKNWDHEWVVFDVASGQTHQLDLVSALILTYCEEGWVALRQIMEGISTDLALPPDYDATKRVLHALNLLKSLDLLEHCPE
jgi:hypothetical protein